MKAIFELEFESDDMWDEESVNTKMDGDWLKAMRWLYKEEGFGIFGEEPKLVRVDPAPTKEKLNG